MESVQNGDKSYTLPDTGRFAPGNPGRPRGVKDRRARAGELVAAALLGLPKVQARVKSILQNPKTDARIFVTLWTFLHEQRYGKAVQRLDVDVRRAAEEIGDEQGVATEPLLALATQIAAQSAAAEIQ